MTFQFSLKGTAAALLLAVAAAGPAAAQTYTQTYSGTLTGGIDTAGLFGTAGNDLTGTNFSVTYTYVLNPSFDFSGPGSYAAEEVVGHGLVQSATLTIDGTAFSFAVQNDTYEEVAITNLAGYGYGEGVGFVEDGAGNYLEALVESIGWNSIDDLTTAQSYADPNCGNDGVCNSGLYFGVNGDTLSGNITSFSQNSVPEPGSLALLGCGLIGLGAAAKRRAPRAIG